MDVNDLCNTLALAAIPTRLRALRVLAKGPADLAALSAAMGDTGSAVGGTGGIGIQLDLLRSGGLVEAGKAGDASGDGLVYRLTAAGRRVLMGVDVVAGGSA